MARARRRSARPSGLDPLRVNRSYFARRSVAAGCPHRAHRLERFEPYEGRLSSTVLRGGWAGNSPPPLDPRPGSFPIAGTAPEIPFPADTREPRQAVRGRSGRWIVPDGKVAQDCPHYLWVTRESPCQRLATEQSGEIQHAVLDSQDFDRLAVPPIEQQVARVTAHETTFTGAWPRAPIPWSKPLPNLPLPQDVPGGCSEPHSPIPDARPAVRLPADHKVGPLSPVARQA